MNINFELYRVFYTVANTGNITKAAEELMISQPAISKSIKNLENQLGGNLFVRTKRGVHLTDEGREFYNYIKQAMEYIYNAEHRFTDMINLEVGTIKIGISTTLTRQFLLPYLKEFHRQYPKIDIQLGTNAAAELIGKLKNGLLDIVFINLPLFNEKDVEVIKCKKVQDGFVVSDLYAHLVGKDLTLEELNDYPLILQAKGSITRGFLDEFAAQNNVILKPNMELASYTLVSEFTKIGLGIGYVTKEFLKNEFKNKELFELKITPPIPSRHIGMVLSKSHIPNFSTKKLIEIIKRDLKK